MMRLLYAACVVGLTVSLPASGSPQVASAQVVTDPADGCAQLPDDTDRFSWEYIPPESGQPRLRCSAQELDNSLHGATGSWAVAIRDFTTGETLLINADRQFVGGSLYKLGVAAEALARIDNGTLAEDSAVVVGAQDVDEQYGGSRYTAGTILTVQQALASMLTASDNGAALALVDRLSLTSVNNRFVQLGMPDTRLVYDSETTARDLLTYFSLLADGKIVSEQASDEIIHLLAAQQINDRIPAGLPSGEAWWVAHKTGNVDDMLGDAGVVYTTNGAFALVIINQHVVNYGDSLQIFRIVSRVAYRAVIPESPASEVELH
jgi:beta-lactamase class A